MSGKVLSTVFAILLTDLQAAHSQAQDSSPSSKEVLPWMETVGFPSLKDRRYIRVTITAKFNGDQEPPVDLVLDGFLLNEDEKNFSFFFVSLQVEGFQMSDIGWWPLTAVTIGKKPVEEIVRVNYTLLDLKAEATALAEKLRAPFNDTEYDKESHADFGRTLPRVAAIAVFAGGCHQNGLTDLAGDLIELDAAKLRREDKMMDDRKPKPLRQFLEDAFCETLLWRATLEFENPSTSRKELLATFRDLAARFPKGEDQPQIRETIGILEKMVAEDEAHHSPPLDQLTKEDRVRELIFRLRDQNGAQIMQPGYCDIFARDDPKKLASPAAQLVKIGYDAVPQLIPEIGDPRLTRSVGFSRAFYFSHQVLRVGDCVTTILARIANRDFYQPETTSSTMFSDQKIAATREAVEKWWTEFQKKGEKQSLIEAVEKGDENSPPQAETLTEKYREAARPALIRSIGACKQDYVCAQLIQLLGTIPGAETESFLRGKVRSTPGLVSRFEAARTLLNHGDACGIPVMINEWKKWSSKTKAEQSNSPQKDGVAELAEFLANCGKVDAVQALAHSISDLNVDGRTTILSGFAPKDHKLAHGIWMFGLLNSDQPLIAPRAVDQGFEGAIEAQLVSSLDDRDIMGISGGIGEKGINYPPGRLCDYAAFIMAKRWPQKYSFYWSLYWLSNDRQIDALRTTWRTGNGLPSISATPVSASKPSENRIPNAVVEIRMPPTADGKIVKHFAELRNAVLTPERLRQEISFLITHSQKNGQGFTFVAERAAPESGFIVDIRWELRAKHQPLSVVEAIAGREVINDWESNGEEFEGIATKFQKALTAAPTGEVAVHYSADFKHP